MATTTQRRDPDRRPSMRIQLATKLIDSGQDPTQIAHTCKVPVALLEFITTHRGATQDED